jgi:hypothetical protein
LTYNQASTNDGGGADEWNLTVGDVHFRNAVISSFNVAQVSSMSAKKKNMRRNKLK